MYIPLPSVAALAQFSLTGEQLAQAAQALQAETQWQVWIDQVELHGLSGFANKHIGEHDLPVPESMRLPLRALQVRHQSAAAARYKVLSDIDAVFNQADIPYLGLKGVALAPYLYSQPYLRPMRDIDLLVPKVRQQDAADCLRDIGFELPTEQPSRFMRGSHQLPNATKTVDGFVCSVELHHDGLSRDVPEQCFYPTTEADLQRVRWQDIEFNAFEDVKMLHQVCRHYEGTHPGGVLKLINAMDVVGLAQMVVRQGQWGRLATEYPHVLTTLCCLHLLTPLPEPLQAELKPLPTVSMNGVGATMGSLRNALRRGRSLTETFRLLFRPSDWWLHLYYNVNPDRSLLLVKWFKHPLRIANWLSRRLYSRLRGG